LSCEFFGLVCDGVFWQESGAGSPAQAEGPLYIGRRSESRWGRVIRWLPFRNYRIFPDCAHVQPPSSTEKWQSRFCLWRLP